MLKVSGNLVYNYRCPYIFKTRGGCKCLIDRQFDVAGMEYQSSVVHTDRLSSFNARDAVTNLRRIR